MQDAEVTGLTGSCFLTVAFEVGPEEIGDGGNQEIPPQSGHAVVIEMDRRASEPQRRDK